MHFALFATGVVWMVASSIVAGRSAEGIATRFDWLVIQPLLRQGFFLLLLLVGFTALNWIAIRAGGIRATNALPTRETAVQEFRLGGALGWAMLLVTVVPMVLLRSLHPQFWWAWRAWWLTGVSVLTVALATLALEVAFRGWLFRQLSGALGVSAATVVMSLAYALAVTVRTGIPSGLQLLGTFLLGVVLAMAYVRTHALWLGWGAHFAWALAMGVLFGLPVAGQGQYSTVVTTYATGAHWLTGGDFGPEGSAVAVIVLIGFLPVLYKLTRDYAWLYTHPPIVPGGYPMEAQPPAAHLAMENAVKPAPLVQILGSTPTAPSTMQAVTEHLRADPADNIPE